MPNGNHRWIFTLNNPTDEEKLFFSQACPSSPLYKGLAFQQEIAPDTGTVHIQGFVIFCRPTTLLQARSHSEWSLRAHWEVSNGTPKQCVAYVTKLESRDPQFGEPVVLGCCLRYLGNREGVPAHLDITTFVDAVREDPDIGTDQLIDAGGLEILALKPNLLGTLKGMLLENLRRNGFTCDLYYGPTGVGKSRLADHLYPNAYRKAHGKWFDGYNGESTIILDDFDSDFMPIGDFLRLVDRYPYRTEVKGGYLSVVATNFIITSNQLPTEWYPNAGQRRVAAVCRRIGRVLQFDEDGSVWEFRSFFSPVRDVPTNFPLPWEQ